MDNDIAEGACRQVFLGACAEAGFSPQFAVETHAYQMAIPFVATGIGIAVIPLLGIGHCPVGWPRCPWCRQPRSGASAPR
ncbi:LysR substrate-binding domain-containing protein [Saccharopolyspora sp. NPDC000995]